MTRKPVRYVVRPLDRAQLRLAYPLVQAAEPHLTLEQWTSYAEALCEGRRKDKSGTGVMSVQNPEGYIHGIYCHEVETDIRHGRILKVGNLVAANLYDSAGIMDRMIDSMIDKARDNSCVAIQVDLPQDICLGPQPVEGIASTLRGAGYKLATVALCRPVQKK